MNTTETSNRFATPASGSSSGSPPGGGKFRNLAIGPFLLRLSRLELRGDPLRDEAELPDRLADPPLPDGQDHEGNRAAHDADDRRRERDDHLPRHRLEVAARERCERGTHRDQRPDEAEARTDLDQHPGRSDARADTLLVREQNMLEPAVREAGFRMGRL